MVSRIRISVCGIGGFESQRGGTYLLDGLPTFEVVGLPDTAVKEARDRVRAAIKNTGFVSAQPSDGQSRPGRPEKAGTLYDLPILIGILAAQGEIKQPQDDCAFLGELALDGTLRRISGALPMAIAAERCGVKKLFLPAENASEAAFAEGVEVFGVESVGELISHLRGEKRVSPPKRRPTAQVWRCRILPTSRDRRASGVPLRWPPRAGTTCFLSARRAPASR